MLKLYRLILQLYPPAYRRGYGDEMIEVFQEAQARAWAGSVSARGAFCLREISGLLRGALQENICFLSESSPFSSRRFTMQSEFRFPKSTMVLMCLILGGVILAIEKARTIAISVPYSNPYVTIRPLPWSFPSAIAILFGAVYVGAIAAWAILFGLQRSGVHRLAALDPDHKS